MKNRENFGSQASAVMALVGSAVGLGNIWRFPYMVGQNGGAAFVVIYLISCLLLSMPILMSESIIGHRTHLGPFGAMETLAPGTAWKWMGLLTVGSSLIIMSYYSVVGGWSLEYLLKACSLDFSSGDAEEISSEFGAFISSPWAPLAFHTVFLGLCALIVVGGVKSGIEKFNRITTPLLFILIVIIMIYSVNLKGASEGVKYMLKPDFSKITPQSIASAMGQSFFSLSLGVGTILTYSSYIRKEENTLVSGLGTAGFDLLFAILAGFAIMPAVFAAGIEPGAGPGLIFQTLPYIFAKMGVATPWLSNAVAILFFITIVFAALSSAISMYEVGVAYLVDDKKMARGKAVALIFIGCWSLGVLCSLSFGPLQNVHILGQTIFNFCDKLTSNFLMTFGGLLFTVFVGWKMPRDVVREEFTCGGTQKFNCAVFDTFYFILRYVAPIAIVVIFFTNFA